MNNFNEITRDKFFTVDYVKKDGSRRTLNGRLGVTKYLKNKDNVNNLTKLSNYVTMFEIGKGYRSLQQERILQLRVGHKRYTAVQLSANAPVQFVEI